MKRCLVVVPWEGGLHLLEIQATGEDEGDAIRAVEAEFMPGDGPKGKRESEP